MAWDTTADVREFLARSGRFLASDPVRNTVLLTEAHFWRRLPSPPPGARFGWWVDRGEVRAAFVHIPDHDPICSPLSGASAADLPIALADAVRLGIEEQDAAAVTEAWRVHGQVVRPSGGVTLLRLHDLRSRAALPDGSPRPADAGDRPLLRDWFRLFQERFPADPSHVEFVVDHPLEAGAVIMWEVSGRPVAMSSRTPEVAGMVRMGLAFQPTGGSTYADAAFAIGCAEAARTAEHVLVLVPSGAPESTGEFRALGFVPVLGRVLLEVADA